MIHLMALRMVCINLYLRIYPYHCQYKRQERKMPVNLENILKIRGEEKEKVRK